MGHTKRKLLLKKILFVVQCAYNLNTGGRYDVRI